MKCKNVLNVLVFAAALLPETTQTAATRNPLTFDDSP